LPLDVIHTCHVTQTIERSDHDVRSRTGLNWRPIVIVLGPADADVNFGPLSTAATHIQVATNLILPTHPLPDFSGMPAGRWWMQLVPRDGSLLPNDGRMLDTPRPLDDHGHPVSWQRF
jgi:hypothetical protein